MIPHDRESLPYDRECVTIESERDNILTPYPPYPVSKEKEHSNSGEREARGSVRSGRIGSSDSTSRTDNVKPSSLTSNEDRETIGSSRSSSPRYLAKLASGTCNQCPSPAVPGRVLCQPCADKNTVRGKRLRDERRRDRICSVCTSPITPPDERTRCGQLYSRCYDCRPRVAAPAFRRLTVADVLELRAAHIRGRGHLKRRAGELGIKYSNAYKAAIGQTWRQV